jgi:regulator of replication initiation timing
MMPEDYKTWVKLQQELEERKRKSANREPKTKTEEEEAVEDQLFEAVSKRAWTDVLLQLYKVGFHSPFSTCLGAHFPLPCILELVVYFLVKCKTG